MRWSKLDDRFMTWRGTKDPPFHTGCTRIRLMPTIATSGWLMIGVDTMPPSAPSEVTVIVEPDRSAAGAVPSLAASALLVIAPARSHRPRLSAWRTTGTIRPAGVCVATPTCAAS